MSKDRDGRVSQAQMKKLLDLLNNNKFVQNGRVDYKSINKVKFWKRIAVHLNNIDNGAIKDCDKWCKVSDSLYSLFSIVTSNLIVQLAPRI